MVCYNIKSVPLFEGAGGRKSKFTPILFVFRGIEYYVASHHGGKYHPLPWRIPPLFPRQRGTMDNEIKTLLFKSIWLILLKEYETE